MEKILENIWRTLGTMKALVIILLGGMTLSVARSLPADGIEAYSQLDFEPKLVQQGDVETISVQDFEKALTHQSSNSRGGETQEKFLFEVSDSTPGVKEEGRAKRQWITGGWAPAFSTNFAPYYTQAVAANPTIQLQQAPAVTTVVSRPTLQVQHSAIPVSQTISVAQPAVAVQQAPAVTAVQVRAPATSQSVVWQSTPDYQFYLHQRLPYYYQSYPTTVLQPSTFAGRVVVG